MQFLFFGVSHAYLPAIVFILCKTYGLTAYFSFRLPNNIPYLCAISGEIA